MSFLRHEAIYNTHPEVLSISPRGPLDKNSNLVTIDENLIAEEIERLKIIEGLKRLRIERDRKLAEVDWWTSRALDGTPLTTEQTAYRQALRDLPENSANVAIDENITLINVESPVKPE